MSNQAIAEKVQLDPIRHREYPTSSAQDKVLAGLGITRKVSGHSQADQLLTALGLTVTSRREGRNHIPVVIIREEGGQMNRYGEGEGDAIRRSDKLDLSGIRQWIRD